MGVWSAAVAIYFVASTNAFVQNWNNIESSEALQTLQARDTCPSDHSVSCSAVDSKLPSNFCCDSGTVCQSIDRSSSAICCPSGKDCSQIAPIQCDVSLQDASNNTGPIFTTKVNGTLPSCGSDTCCPFGYSCGKNGNDNICILNKADAGAASTTKVTSTTSATATSTATVSQQGIDSDNPPAKKESSFSVGTFFAGFFPGILVGALAVLAWVVFTKRNKKPVDNRGLNLQGHGARPFISAPIMNQRQSNQRSDFLGRSRSRARSLFSSHRHTRTMDTPEILAAKMPTPPANGGVPVNYINDMPDVPITPHRRIGYSYDDSHTAVVNNEKREISPISVDTFDPHDRETIRIYSPEMNQQRNNNTDMPQIPMAAIPPLRGMNTQRRVSPSPPRRRDSGLGMGLGTPYKTPEKKPTVVSSHMPSMYATYHDIATANSPEDSYPVPQTLTPARYDPNANVQPSAAAALASSRLSKAQQSLRSQQQRPVIPPRPEARMSKRPETQYSDEFDFDDGLEQADSPVMQSPPREAYKSQAASNPYAQPRANPTSTFDDMIPAAPSTQFDKSNKDKHATNATTFTTMLRSVGFPDPGNQMPPVPQLDMKKVNAGKNKRVCSEVRLHLT